MYKIMVVDDEKRIIDMITQFMKISQIEVITANSGKEALAKIDDSIQLVLLDIKMEDMDGLEVCKKLREKNDIPILFLSSNSTQYDKILGLGLGADDYITKPFDPLELIARVKANIRRYNKYNKNAKNQSTIQFDDFVIYRNSYKILKQGNEINLSATEFKLLLYFIDNVHTVLTRKQILINVWESELYDKNTVTKYVKRLRDKLEDNGKYIKSIRGIGYMFEAEIYS